MNYSESQIATGIHFLPVLDSKFIPPPVKQFPFSRWPSVNGCTARGCEPDNCVPRRDCFTPNFLQQIVGIEFRFRALFTPTLSSAENRKALHFFLVLTPPDADEKYHRADFPVARAATAAATAFMRVFRCVRVWTFHALLRQRCFAAMLRQRPFALGAWRVFELTVVGSTLAENVFCFSRVAFVALFISVTSPCYF